MRLRFAAYSAASVEFVLGRERHYSSNLPTSGNGVSAVCCLHSLTCPLGYFFGAVVVPSAAAAVSASENRATSSQAVSISLAEHHYQWREINSSEGTHIDSTATYEMIAKNWKLKLTMTTGVNSPIFIRKIPKNQVL